MARVVLIAKAAAPGRTKVHVWDDAAPAAITKFVYPESALRLDANQNNVIEIAPLDCEDVCSKMRIAFSEFDNVYGQANASALIDYFADNGFFQ